MGRPLKLKKKPPADQPMKPSVQQKANAATIQGLEDLMLLRETKDRNPFIHPKRKRSQDWQFIAERLKQVHGTDTRSDGNCRERIQQLMTKFKAKKMPTGWGAEDLSEAEEILTFLIEEEDRTKSSKEVENEKKTASDAAAAEARQLALERLKAQKDRIAHSSVHEEHDEEGLRFASAIISGLDVYKCLKFESGVHRVQRTPKTEKAGRIHTSTVSVAVLPKPRDVEIVLKKSDLRIETCRSTGAGGQHVNKTESAIRVVHLPTNIAVECQEQRSQIDNKMTALERLAAKLYQIQIDARAATESFDRKMQVGSSSRSEKIRTYNFPQDRLTDHRTGTNFHGLTELIKGGSKFHDLVEHMVREYRKESIGHLLLASFSAKTVSDQEKRKVG